MLRRINGIYCTHRQRRDWKRTNCCDMSFWCFSFFFFFFVVRAVTPVNLCFEPQSSTSS